MTKRAYCTGLLIIVMIFAVILAGCSFGDSDPDPISVNMKLPSIESVPPYTGVFPATEAEAAALIGELLFESGVFELPEIPDSSLPNMNSIRKSILRSVRSEPDEIIYNDEELYPGARVTGFETTNVTTSRADDNKPTVGDYVEYLSKTKMAVNYDNAVTESFTLNGKSTADRTANVKITVTSLTPDIMSLFIKLNAKESYALSVSKDGKGLKFVMTMTVGLSTTVNSVDIDSEEVLNSLLEKASVNFTLNIYNNDNVRVHHKVLSGYDAVCKYFGIDSL